MWVDLWPRSYDGKVSYLQSDQIKFSYVLPFENGETWSAGHWATSVLCS